MTRIVKIAVLTVWLLLLLGLARRDFFIARLDSGEQTAVLQAAKYQQYYGVHLNGKRIGWVMEDVRPSSSGFSIRQQAALKLKVLQTVQPVNMDLSAELDSGMRLKTFQFTFSSAFYSTKAEGRTEGKKVFFALNTGRTVIKDAVTLPDTPFLPLNQRGYLLAKMTRKGDRVKHAFIEPMTLTPHESVITYNGRNKELIGGRVYNLHEFTETYSGMKTRFWMDDKGKIIKEESPAGFVYEAEAKFKAMDIQDSGDELLAAVAVQYSGSLLPEGSKTAAYRLRFPPEAQVELNGGRQQFAEGKLRISRDVFPPALPASPDAACAEKKYLKPSRYVQADDPKIVAKAKEIVGTTTDPAQQVRLLTDWVYEHIEKRPVIGLPDALTTLDSRLGDCNEHAALFAALSRSLGLPTAIAAGVTMQRNAFYYHAWNEVCLGGQWVSVDTTTRQLPADLYHIRFTRADVEGQIAIGGLLGKLEIEILPPQ
ncbi:transglutaminase-like domain-containing protein [Candidatus Electronema sp. JM]|uniref:transglutaminase-like domain-containing protein n=1 Tax=Candidatus Electronema sp. JM TaxID=3401571 RepID=UPI003AA958C1